MPTGDRSRHGRRSVGTARLSALSDGVFAIAMTLLVLDIAVHPPGTPLEQLLNAWPIFMAYLVSFLTIGGAWLGHTQLTEELTQVDPIFMRLNLLVLLAVGFLPFPTRLVAEALQEPDALRVEVTLYGLTLLAIRLLGSALYAHARRQGLESPQEDRADAEDVPRRLWPVVVGYVIAIVVGLVLPDVAVVLYLVIALYLVVPFREVGSLLVRRRRASG